MAQESDAPDWSTRLALAIAGEVRRHRQAQGLSAQQLADRCAAIGMPIQRSVLANLESGRRTTVTVAEVLVLAQALGVPPGALMFPVGRERYSEVLPGVMQDPLDAVDWLAGRTAKGDDMSAAEGYSTLAYLRRHQSLVGRLRALIQRRDQARLQFVRVSPYEESHRRFAELQEEASANFAELSDLVSGEASQAAVDAANSRRLQLGDRIAELSDHAYQYNYAKKRVDRLEEGVESLERQVETFRESLRREGLVPPSLPEDVAYLESAALYEQQPLPTLVGSQLGAPPKGGTDGSLAADELLTGVRDDEGKPLPAFSIDSSEQAKEVAEELFRIMSERGFQLTRSELHRDEEGVE